MDQTKRTNNHQQTKTEDRASRTLLKTEGDLWYLGIVSSSCSTCGTRRVTIAKNTGINHEWGNDLIIITTNGTYTWLFVTLIVHMSSFKKIKRKHSNFTLSLFLPVTFKTVIQYLHQRSAQRKRTDQIRNIHCTKTNVKHYKITSWFCFCFNYKRYVNYDIQTSLCKKK